MVYLLTFPIKINQTQVNIPYMDPQGYKKLTIKRSHVVLTVPWEVPVRMDLDP